MFPTVVLSSQSCLPIVCTIISLVSFGSSLESDRLNVYEGIYYVQTGAINTVNESRPEYLFNKRGLFVL